MLEIGRVPERCEEMSKVPGLGNWEGVPERASEMVTGFRPLVWRRATRRAAVVAIFPLADSIARTSSRI